ncbi:EAL domain-containing protein [Bacillus salitolerans]|uniref:EAL domain-containing protein n=1 Tax=Bacillus salitolerans TaxID=1437434 RepID=A0ABW4LZF0_9BACI
MPLKRRNTIEVTSLLALFILAVIGNIVKIELFLGIHIVFGSIFIYIMIQYFGIRTSVIAATLTGLCTVYLWGTPFGFLWYTMEAVFVAVAYHKYKRSLIFGAITYYFIIGVPFYIIFNYILTDFDWITTVLVLLKQGINTLLNVAIAHIIIILVEFSGLFPSKRRVSLQTIILNLLLIFFLIPVVYSLISLSKIEFRETENAIQNQIEEVSERLSARIVQDYQNHLTAINGIANRVKNHERGELLTTDLMLMQDTFPDFKVLYVSNQNNQIILKNQLYELKDYKIDPLYSFSERTKRSKQPYLSDVFLAAEPYSEPVVTLTVPVEKNIYSTLYVVGVLKPITFLKAIQATKMDKMQITIVDRENRVVATNDKQQEIMEPITLSKSESYFQEWKVMPIEGGVRNPDVWANSGYSQFKRLDGEVPYALYIKLPNQEFAHILYTRFIKLFLVAIFFSGVALVLSYLVSNWIQQSFRKVSDLTDNLPAKISQDVKINWPTMMIKEVDNIVRNFKKTEKKLRDMFHEVLSAQKNLEFLAHYDQLTHLYNRTYLMTKFEEIVAKGPMNQKIGIIFLDLDRFKIINDTLGHESGDLLLIEVSRRIKDICEGKEFIISRQSGDEFIILMPGITSHIEPEYIAKQTIHSLSLPYTLKENEYFLTASIGISMYPEDGKDIHTIIKNASMAMNYAKEKGKNNYQFYNEEIIKQVLSKVEIERELRYAIERDQLFLYYQPQIDLLTGNLKGVETLVRWIHPELGFISPADFIPVAEESGLIIRIGEWILQKACEDAKSWQEAGYKPVNISVNISMSQFLHSNLIHLVKTSLAESGLEPRYLKLEITESVAMSQPEQVITKLDQLKTIGVELALDDFGTGYSSLNYLKKLPVDVLKIDRSFIQEMEHDEDDITIVKALIEVAHSLGMIVIAEGVETLSQKEILERIHCDQLQGYIFSKPLPKLEIEGLFERELSSHEEVHLH